MSLWTTSTTGLETALAAAIGSTLQQHTNSISNNLKGQPHIIHISNGGSVGGSLHHLNHNSNSNNNNFQQSNGTNINHLQHHLNHHNSSSNHNLNCKYLIKHKHYTRQYGTVERC